MAYITVSELRTAYLGIDNTRDDVLIASFISQAQGMIEEICRRAFEASADAIRYFDSVRDVCDRTLYLDKDLCAITSITNGDADVLATTEYVTEPRNSTPYWAIRLLASSGLAWESKSTTGDNENAITIVGRWAYSTTAPETVKGLCRVAAAALYKQRENPIGETVLLEGQNFATPRDVYAWLEKQCNLAGLVRL